MWLASRCMCSACSFKCLWRSYLSQAVPTQTGLIVRKVCERGNSSPSISSREFVKAEDWSEWKKGVEGNKHSHRYSQSPLLWLSLVRRRPQDMCSIPFHYADRKNDAERSWKTHRGHSTSMVPQENWYNPSVAPFVTSQSTFIPIRAQFLSVSIYPNPAVMDSEHSPTSGKNKSFTLIKISYIIAIIITTIIFSLVFMSHLIKTS